MAKKSNLKLAKKSKETEKNSVEPKSETIIELATESEVEDKETKAKKMVENLLDVVNLKPNEEKLVELDESEDTTDIKNVQWFEEQLQKLTEDNQRLKAENEQLNIDYGKIFEENQRIKSGGVTVNTEVESGVINLFNELQNNYMTMGFSPSGESNFRILVPGFLNRLIKFFPFLAEHKRY